jgi:SLT domain-containing protein
MPLGGYFNLRRRWKRWSRLDDQKHSSLNDTNFKSYETRASSRFNAGVLRPSVGLTDHASSFCQDKRY